MRTCTCFWPKPSVIPAVVLTLNELGYAGVECVLDDRVFPALKLIGLEMCLRVSATSSLHNWNEGEISALVVFEMFGVLVCLAPARLCAVSASNPMRVSVLA